MTTTPCWIVFDPVSGEPFTVEVRKRPQEVLPTIALVVCDSRDKALKVLTDLFGNGDDWAERRFEIREGPRETLSMVMEFGIYNMWDGERITEWRQPK